jgi:ribosomal protein L31E
MVKEFKEKIITVNLKKAFAKPVTKRTKATIHALRKSVIKETRGENIKISNGINEAIWKRGLYHATKKMTVKIIPEGNIMRVYLPDEKIIIKEKKKETKGLKGKAEEMKKQMENKNDKKENKKTSQNKKEENVPEKEKKNKIETDTPKKENEQKAK